MKKAITYTVLTRLSLLNLSSQIKKSKSKKHFLPGPSISHVHPQSCCYMQRTCKFYRATMGAGRAEDDRGISLPPHEDQPAKYSSYHSVSLSNSYVGQRTMYVADSL